MAKETRQSVVALLGLIVEEIGAGKDMGDVAADLDEAASAAREVAEKEVEG